MGKWIYIDEIHSKKGLRFMKKENRKKNHYKRKKGEQEEKSDWRKKEIVKLIEEYDLVK
jgi:hypothetical protein